MDWNRLELSRCASTGHSCRDLAEASPLLPAAHSRRGRNSRSHLAQGFGLPPVTAVIPLIRLFTKFMVHPVTFPPHVWNAIKAFAIQSCPRCNGECAPPGNMPCWLDTLSELLNDPEYSPRRNFSGFRRYWFDLHRIPSRGAVDPAPASQTTPRESSADTCNLMSSHQPSVPTAPMLPCDHGCSSRCRGS